MYEDHSIGSIFNAINGWRKNENKKSEQQYRDEWERTRFSVFSLINIQLDRSDKMKRYGDLITFPWDENAGKGDAKHCVSTSGGAMTDAQKKAFYDKYKNAK